MAHRREPPRRCVGTRSALGARADGRAAASLRTAAGKAANWHSRRVSFDPGGTVSALDTAPILLCYDRSAGARHAIEVAAAQLPGRKAIVLHVWSPIAVLAAAYGGAISLPTYDDAELQEAARRTGRRGRGGSEGGGPRRAGRCGAGHLQRHGAHDPRGRGLARRRPDRHGRAGAVGLQVDAARIGLARRCPARAPPGADRPSRRSPPHRRRPRRGAKPPRSDMRGRGAGAGKPHAILLTERSES